jgi:tetratricopeptide (TPR) repeat protein
VQRANSLTRRGEYREAIRSYEALLTEDVTAGNVELRAYLLSEIAYVEIELGDYAAAEKRTREALSGLTSRDRTHTGAFVLVEGGLADALRAQGRYVEAKQRINHALVISKEILSPVHPRVGHLLITLSRILQATGDLRRAEEACRRAITILENAGCCAAGYSTWVVRTSWSEANRVHLGTAYQNLAVVEVLRKRPKQALDTIRLALTAWHEVLPPDHPFMVYGLSTEIAAYRDLRQFRDAEAIIPEALRRCLSSFGPDHPERVILLNNAAKVYLADRKYEEAEALLRDAVAAGKRCFHAGDPLMIQVLRNYADALEHLNRGDEASRMRAESDVISVKAPPRSRH